MALRIAFAIFRWLTGRRPVCCRCLIRPRGDTYSDITEKFCARVTANVSTRLTFLLSEVRFLKPVVDCLARIECSAYLVQVEGVQI